MVIAVRKADKKDEPYCAFEYKMGKIIQCRQDHEVTAPDEVWEFAREFANLMNKRKAIAA